MPASAWRTPALSSGDLEAVASSPDSLDVARVFRVRLNLLAKFADVDVYRARRYVLRVTPYRVQYLVACEHLTGVAHEEVNQPEFGCGGGGRLATHGEHHGATINAQLAGIKHRGFQRSLEAAQHSFDSGHQLPRAKGLAHVVIGAQLEPDNAVGLGALGGDKNH